MSGKNGNGSYPWSLKRRIPGKNGWKVSLGWSKPKTRTFSQVLPRALSVSKDLGLPGRRGNADRPGPQDGRAGGPEDFQPARDETVKGREVGLVSFLGHLPKWSVYRVFQKTAPPPKKKQQTNSSGRFFPFWFSLEQLYFFSFQYVCFVRHLLRWCNVEKKTGGGGG